MATIVAIAAVTAMLGVMLSQIVGLSRMVFAMARRGDLPGWLADVHPRYQVPGRAVLAVGAIAMIVAATGTLRGVASAASFTILVYYGIANVAALKMPRDAKLYPDVVPVVGLAGCVALAFALPLSVIATGLALTGAGFIARAIVRAGSPGRA
jgi:APA family basic amino acid/polyamine antiporter